MDLVSDLCAPWGSLRCGSGMTHASEGWPGSCALRLSGRRVEADWKTSLLCLTLALLVGACAHTEAPDPADAASPPQENTSAPEADGGPGEADGAGHPVAAEPVGEESTETGAAPGAFSQDELAEAVIRILSARRDKADGGPLAEALALRLPRVERYVLGEFARMGPKAQPYREQVAGLLARTDESVRAAAATALGKMGDPAAVDGLLRALADDRSALVRRSAAGALGELRESRAGEALVAALDDPAPEVRQAAVLALAQLKWGAAGSALAHRLQVDGDAQVRELAAYALGELGATQWVAALARALAKDASSRVRLNAAEALGKVEAAGALDLLVTALEDRDVHVREAVVVALGRLGDPQAIAPLEKLLQRSTSSGPEQLAARTWQTLLKLTSEDRETLWNLAVGRYRAGDLGRAREASQELLRRFAAAPGAGELWSATVLLGIIACDRNNCEQAEPLLRQALAELERGAVPEEQVSGLSELFGVAGAPKEFLMERLAGVLAPAGREKDALEVLDELARQYPERAEHWWGRRHEVLAQLAEAGNWAVVDFYLKRASQAGPDYGGGYHGRLAALAQRADEALDGTPPQALVALWLGAPEDVAGSLEPRLRARRQDVLVVLVDALEDPEVGARRRAHELLLALSGQDFGFVPAGEPEARAAGVTRWRTWLAGQSRAPAAGGPTKPAGRREPTDRQTTQSNAQE